MKYLLILLFAFPMLYVSAETYPFQLGTQYRLSPDADIANVCDETMLLDPLGFAFTTTSITKPDNATDGGCGAVVFEYDTTSIPDDSTLLTATMRFGITFVENAVNCSIKDIQFEPRIKIEQNNLPGGFGSGTHAEDMLKDVLNGTTYVDSNFCTQVTKGIDVDLGNDFLTDCQNNLVDNWCAVGIAFTDHSTRDLQNHTTIMGYPELEIQYGTTITPRVPFVTTTASGPDITTTWVPTNFDNTTQPIITDYTIFVGENGYQGLSLPKTHGAIRSDIGDDIGAIDFSRLQSLLSFDARIPWNQYSPGLDNFFHDLNVTAINYYWQNGGSFCNPFEKVMLGSPSGANNHSANGRCAEHFYNFQDFGTNFFLDQFPQGEHFTVGVDYSAYPEPLFATDFTECDFVDDLSSSVNRGICTTDFETETCPPTCNEFVDDLPPTTYTTDSTETDTPWNGCNTITGCVGVDIARDVISIGFFGPTGTPNIQFTKNLTSAVVFSGSGGLYTVSKETHVHDADDSLGYELRNLLDTKKWNVRMDINFTDHDTACPATSTFRTYIGMFESDHLTTANDDSFIAFTDRVCKDGAPTPDFGVFELSYGLSSGGSITQTEFPLNFPQFNSTHGVDHYWIELWQDGSVANATVYSDDSFMSDTKLSTVQVVVPESMPTLGYWGIKNSGTSVSTGNTQIDIHSLVVCGGKKTACGMELRPSLFGTGGYFGGTDFLVQNCKLAPGAFLCNPTGDIFGPVDVQNPQGFINQTSWTFFTWLNYGTAPSSTQTILTWNSDLIEISGQPEEFPGSIVGPDKFEINIDSNEIFLEFNGTTIVSEPYPLTLNEWFHVGMVRDGNNFRIYYNGIQVGIDTVDTVTFGEPIPFCFDESGQCFYFIGTDITDCTSNTDCDVDVSAITGPYEPDFTGTQKLTDVIVDDLGWTDNAFTFSEMFNLASRGLDIPTEQHQLTPLSYTQSFGGAVEKCYQIVATNSIGDSSPTIIRCGTTEGQAVIPQGGGVSSPTVIEFLDVELTSSIFRPFFGELVEKEYQIVWDSDSPIKVNAIIVGDSPFNIMFPNIPFLLEADSSGESSAIIPFTVRIPEGQCSGTIFLNCVDPRLYEIPVEFGIFFKGQNIQVSTDIRIDMSREVDLVIYAVFGMVGIAVVGVIGSSLRPSRKHTISGQLK